MTRAVDIHDAVTQPAASSGIRPRIPRALNPGTTREEAIVDALSAVADVLGANHRYSVSIGAGNVVATACVYRGRTELCRIGELRALTYESALRMLLDEATRLRNRVCDGVSSWP